jgi:hypothetical protein
VKVKVRGLEIEVDDFDELDELIRRYSGGDAAASKAAIAAVPPSGEAQEEPQLLLAESSKTTPEPQTPPSARFPSVNKRAAMRKLYKGLKATQHQQIMAELAAKNGHGVDIEEIRRDLKLHEKFKMSGFTAAIRRRAPSYGLNANEVLMVEFRGVVAGQRIYLYSLGPEMLAMMREEGFIAPVKGG